MTSKVLIGIIASFLSLNVLAAAKKESTDTIPFVIYKTPIIYYSAPVTTTASSLPQATMSYTPPTLQGSVKTDMKSSTTISAVEQEASTSNIPTAEVKNLIRQVRDAVCGSVGDSDVRVWVSIDASGKLLGVGASTQSGLEVTFHCKGKNG